MSLFSAIFPRFVAYSPEAVTRWYAKAVAGQPVTVEEHNSVAIAIGLQRDVYANQAEMVVSGEVSIPSLEHNGVQVPSVGWSDRVMPVAGETPAQRAQREAQFHACTFALWGLRDTLRVVPATAPAASVRIASDAQQAAGTVGALGVVQDALAPTVPAGSGIMENAQLATELQNVFSPQAMQGGVSTRALALTSTATLSTAYNMETGRATTRAKIGLVAFAAAVIAVKVFG
jgi:hypothetical protein